MPVVRLAAGASDGQPKKARKRTPPKPRPVLCTDLEALEPTFRVKVGRVLERMAAAGFRPVVYETARPLERAAELGAKGASRAGVKSLHVRDAQGFAHAIDVIDGECSSDGRQVAWGDSLPGTPAAVVSERRAMAGEFFHTLGSFALAERLGWGGTWVEFPDLAHIQDRR